MKEPDFGEVIKDKEELAPPDATNEVVVNTLLMGVDEARSDTMIVVRYNKETHQMVMISIPRDTRVDIPGYGYTKINAAVGKKEGSALAMKTVSNFLGIPIHHYVKVDFKGVEKIVDILGGVKINVPMDMYYVDPAQKLTIDIKKGVQVLDGKKALHFLRFRSGYSDQDLGRIKAQQEFAKAFIDKLTSPAVILNAPRLINTMVENTKTNLDQGEILEYIADINNLQIGNVNMHTVPGAGGNKGIVAYFLHDEQKLREMMALTDEEVGLTKQASQEKTPAVEQVDNTAAVKKEIKIEILNSTSTKGLAGNLKKELEQKGFTVAKIGDTKGLTYSYSRVIDRRGNEKNLNLVAQEAGINIIDSDINTSYDYDITIILGNDRK